jgi:Uma2 family endonuclease
LLVIEVADSSLEYDRGRKAAAYARSGIPELWIVRLGERSRFRVP